MTDNRKLELLAPAGQWESLKAAIANGADAVYFGLSQFSARVRATNFGLGELPEVIAILHSYNVRGYVAFNTLIYSDELPTAGTYVRAIAAAGADAVIVQDLGLAMLIHRMCPDLPIHASTQMTLSEPMGIALARQLGLKRVILPRELCLAEIRAIADSTDLELEAFAHGAICISFSGQCQASASFWGRSGNRGQCGQACRLPYQLIVDGQPVEDSRRYLLSPQDLAACDMVGQLASAGVGGLKIEGRLKGLHYVAGACSVYRQAIDAAAAGLPFAISPQQELQLAQGFSRGFSHGFFAGPDHQALVQGQSPKPRGLMLGTVTDVARKAVVVDLADGVACPKPGDGVLFECPGEVREEEDECGGRVFTARALAAGGAGPVELTFDNAMDLSFVGPGDIVWKTDDPQVRRDLELTTARVEVQRPALLDVLVEATAGQNLRIVFRDDRGNEAVTISEQTLGPARNPATAAMVRDQLSRLGGTPFAIGSLELRSGGGPVDSAEVIIPKSVLNQMRRQAVDELLAVRLAQDVKPIADANAMESLRQEARLAVAARPAPAVAQVSVLVRTLEQARAASETWSSDPSLAGGLVYLELSREDELAQAIDLIRKAGLPLALAGPRIVKPLEESLLARLAQARPQAVLVRNLGELAYFREHCPQATLIADASLNVANELSALFLAGQGIARLTPAYELPLAQMQGLCEIAGGMFELVLHQHVPLMHMAHCVFARLAGSSSCDGCPMPCRRHDLKLRDRNGVDHPVRVDALRRTTVFRGEVESRLSQLPEWARLGVRHFRIELLDETAAQTKELLNQAAGIRQ